MSCDTITDLLVQESGRIGEIIGRRLIAKSPWIGLVKRAAWRDGMGDTISSLQYERMLPTSTTDWTAWTVTDGSEGGACLPTATDVTVGSTTRTHSLKRRALHGPEFCAEDIRFKFNLGRQLDDVMAILEDYSLTEWENRYRRDYSTLVGNKMIVNSTWNSTSFTTTGTYATQTATSILTQGVLNWAKMRLLRDGGAASSALGRDNGAPVLTLVCSAETSDRLIFDNADIRQDLRWGKPSELLASYGVERSYRGFYHVIDPYPRRFTEVGGAYTEQPVWSTTAATKGTKAVLNTAWLNAPYEESYLFDPEVFYSLIPRPLTNPAPNFSFDPVNYLGDWRLKNIISKDCNPDGNIVFHRGILAHSAEPRQVYRGMGFIHKRCDPSPNLITSCS